jgi:hypothetical protein
LSAPWEGTRLGPVPFGQKVRQGCTAVGGQATGATPDTSISLRLRYGPVHMAGRDVSLMAGFPGPAVGMGSVICTARGGCQRQLEPAALVVRLRGHQVRAGSCHSQGLRASHHTAASAKARARFACTRPLHAWLSTAQHGSARLSMAQHGSAWLSMRCWEGVVQFLRAVTVCAGHAWGPRMHDRHACMCIDRAHEGNAEQGTCNDCGRWYGADGIHVMWWNAAGSEQLVRLVVFACVVAVAPLTHCCWRIGLATCGVGRCCAGRRCCWRPVRDEEVPAGSPAWAGGTCLTVASANQHTACSPVGTRRPWTRGVGVPRVSGPSSWERHTVKELECDSAPALW